MAAHSLTAQRASVLTRPQLPCLRDQYTINLAAGCPCDCRYCYTRSFRHYPGSNRLVQYEGIADALRAELARMGKSKKPSRVYLSTGTDPFLTQLQPVLYEVLSILFQHEVPVLILTKRPIPGEFVRLFGSAPEMVNVQVGITTVNEEHRRRFEPHAAAVAHRLDNIHRLSSAGITVEARMDPLIPGFTDTDENLSSLTAALAQTGVRDVRGSYLFLRRAVLGSMRNTIGDAEFAAWRTRYFTETVERFCGGTGSVEVVATPYRLERFRFLEASLAQHSLSFKICQCKNPGIPAQGCHPLVPVKSQPQQLSLQAIRSH